ncbi:hypothetical protein OF83DRAFT_1170444 [Amylostereum chailletii]|nr:hypothetical protein OF83DRAFT_1170444 [Amylostereum chailletii]
MTRYTNIGRKRTFLEAGFHYREDEPADAAAVPSTSVLGDEGKPDEPATPAPATRKRKKSKKGKEEEPGIKNVEDVETVAGGENTGEANDGEGGGKQLKEPEPEGQEGEGEDTRKRSKAKKTKERLKEKNNMKRRKDIADRAAASEHRRLKRIAERHANKVCYACREMGHAAQLCPNTKLEGEQGARSQRTMCYRCGSDRHSLSRCRKPPNQTNPLPFASCFVCKGRGHLASACPKNKDKGIYPNGGSCKLCGEKSHLAKDCNLRKPETNAGSVMFGTGREAGPDEDDFHIFKRKTVEVDRDERSEDHVRRMAKIRAGAHSGIVKAFGTVPQPTTKKVVNF